MKKTALLFAALAFVAINAVADEAKELTIASAQVPVERVWVETEEDVQRNFTETLVATTKDLGEKITLELEKKLADQIAQNLEI